MANLTKTFEFTYTLQRTTVAGTGFTTQTLDLNVLVDVTYTGGPVHDEDSYKLTNIHAIIYDGKNVAELLFMLGTLEGVETQALAEAMELFTAQSAA